MLAVIKHSYIIIIIIISYFFIFFLYFPISYAFQTIQIIWEPILFFKKKNIITLNFLLTRVISSIIARISNLQ